MNLKERAEAAYGAAVGAMMQMGMSSPEIAARWIAGDMPRAADDASAHAELLMRAVDAERSISAEALYLTAALAYGGSIKNGRFGALPIDRQIAYRVFAAVAPVLPTDPPPAPAAMPDAQFRQVKLGPRNRLAIHPDFLPPPEKPETAKPSLAKPKKR